MLAVAATAREAAWSGFALSVICGGSPDCGLRLTDVTMTTNTNLKKNDRVKRRERPGCLGVIKDIREEVIGSGGDAQEKALLVEVQWDNGVVSYFAPEALEAVSAGAA